MRKSISYSLVLCFTLPLMVPIQRAIAIETDISPQTESLMLAQRGGGGSRGGGNRGGARSGGGNSGGRSINRSSVGTGGSGRVNRSSGGDHNRSANQSVNRSPSGDRNRSANPQDRNLNRSSVGATGSGRINRDSARTVDRSAVQNRAQNIDRNNVNRNANNRVNDIDRNQARNRVNNSRDINLNNDRNYSGRVNRNLINTGDRNIVVNPRSTAWGGNAWGWNRGVAWAPNYGYWGGGFWGAAAIGAMTVGVTSAIVNSANNQPTYIVIEQNTPGYQLFDSYGLTQVQCIEDGSQVYVYGPQDSLICANPNNLVQVGYYDADPETLTLIAR